MPELPTGTVTFLFTDIEGSTRLLAELGSGYADSLAEHRRVVREAFAAHGGVEVDTQGDAFFVAFIDAAAALAAAAAAQAALSLPVRMGVHTGEPELTEEGYVGLDVHRAARICAAAHGGQVVVSGRTHACVREHMELRDLGLHRLKDLVEPVRLYQLGGHDFPPLRSLNATNLPVQPNALIGRARELEEITALVRDGARLVTLTGPGGTGKTRLALQAAAELVDDFPDGVFWVPLAALRDSELVLTTIEQTLGARRPLAAHVDEQRLLLLLDNLEQVVDCAPELAEVLARCPNLHLLVTSRVVLKLHAEVECAVSSLDSSESVQLFRERATVAEPVEVVTEICRRLDGLPLAIELAAARTRALPPERLLERLETRLPLLTGGPRDAPERQQTLRATIEWSYDLLDEREAAAFACLSVFAGGCTLEAANEVCHADLDTLQSLVENSLVRADGKRYLMLETIREYAFGRLGDSGEAERLRDAHAEHILALLEGAPCRDARRRSIEQELSNIRAALEWFAERGACERSARLAFEIFGYWAANGPLAECRYWLEEALRSPDLPLEVRARVLRAVCEIARVQGDGERCRSAAEEWLALSGRLGREGSALTALMYLGIGTSMLGDVDGGIALYEDALPKARARGADWEATILLTNLGANKLARGRWARSRELSQEAFKLAQKIGFEDRGCVAAHNTGFAFLMESRFDEAKRFLLEALRLGLEAGQRAFIADPLEALAAVALAEGDVVRAAWLLGAADNMRSEVGTTPAEPEAKRLRLTISDTRAALGEEGYEAASAEGAALTSDEVVALTGIELREEPHRLD